VVAVGIPIRRIVNCWNLHSRGHSGVRRNSNDSGPLLGEGFVVAVVAEGLGHHRNLGKVARAQKAKDLEATVLREKK
jgi:hypothetical protein